jgi:hypothetical protein
MDRIKVSVILPCKGHDHEIEGCLKAWAEQVDRRFEVILLTDADEDCARVAETYTWSYDWLRHIPLVTHHGVCMGARRGVWESDGTHLYFGAMDDRVSPLFLCKSLDLWLEYPHAGLSHTANWICHPGEHDEPAINGAFHGTLRGYHDVSRLREHRQQFCGATTIYRRDYALAAGLYFPELKSAADWFLSAVVAHRHGCLWEPEALVTCAVSSHTYSGGMGPEETGDIQATLDSLTLCPDFADVSDDLDAYRKWGRRGDG